MEGMGQMKNTAGERSASAVKRARKDYLKILRSADDHKRAMERMLSLMKKNPPLGSPESEEMEILGLLIEKYEDEHYPVTPPDPIEAIKFTMDQRGLKKKDLTPYIGSASKVTEVLNGSRNLSLSMIRRLSEGLGIPADILIKAPSRKRA
jgi:HTH-type transcriptional regulator/antitoxin HigA